MASSLLSRSPLARRRAESSRIAPDLRRVAAFLPRSPVTERSYRRIRAASALLERRVPDGVEVTTLGGVRVRLHTPPGPRAIPGPAVLWIHGGGYVIGNPAQDDAWCRRLVRNHGALVAAVDYRLAPDSPYPAPIDDCHAVLVALAERMDEVCEAHANFVRPKLSRKPSQIIDDQVWASFQHDRACIVAAAAGLPGAKNVMWGSDYPHAEGTFPISRQLTDDLFAGLNVSEAVKRDILGLNAAKLFRIDPVVHTSAQLTTA